MRSQRVFYVFLFLCVIALGAQAVYRAAFNDIERTDYTVYTAAGQALLDHRDMYLAENARGWRYVYPPPFAILLVPLAQIPLWLGALIWYLLSAAAIGAAVLMSAALLGDGQEGARKPQLLYGLPLLCVVSLLISGTLRSQASPFMYFLMIAAFYFQLKERPIAAGFSLGCAALLKVFPIVLIVYFVMRRQWRAVLACAATGVLLGIVLPSLYWGWQFNLDQIVRWIEVVGQPAMMQNVDRAQNTDLYGQLLNTLKPRNQSLESLFLTFGMPPDWTRYAVAASAVLMLAAMWFAARRRPRGADHAARMLAEGLLCGAFICWSLLVTPISETHYYGALLLPLTLLAGYADQYSPSERHKRLYLTAGAAFMIVVMVLTAVRETSLWRPLCICTLLLWWQCVRLIGRVPEPAAS
ncbi:MAG: DUF2029 domain-containing protein [Burkholderiaceae bacterium]|jgi:hypothetical protein|nr:DUF2029 domain-containing protein [Burkholderiaceae bacterium]